MSASRTLVEVIPVQLTEEHVGIVGASHADVRVSAICPSLTKIHTMDIEETHVFHATGYRVKSSRQSNEIKFSQLAISCDDAFLSDFLDRIGLDINDIILGPVHCLVEILLQTGSLRSPWVRSLRGSQHITFARVRDPLPRLSDPELIGFVVCFAVKEVVLVGREPELEATLQRNVSASELL